MYGTANAEFRYGSSERYSKLRPATGERAMFTPGPSRKFTLRTRASLPRFSPSKRAKFTSHVAASAAPPAYAVVGPQLRTPMEASDILNRSKPTDGIALV